MPRSQPTRESKSRPPATTPEGREAYMVSLAMDRAEKQILDGTASSQVITHYLKLGSTRNLLEQRRIEQENELLRAKIEQIESNMRTEDLYLNALNAMRQYSGQPPIEEDYED